MNNKFMKILVNPKWESFILHVHKTLRKTDIPYPLIRKLCVRPKWVIL